MAQFVEFDPAKQPKYKVELHVHLDGAIRITTLWELAQKKGIHLDARTLEDLYDACRINCPSSLEDFLKPFAVIFSVIYRDLEVLERIAYEFCEDIAKQGVLYCEVRYNPHLLAYGLGEASLPPTLTPEDTVIQEDAVSQEDVVTPRDVVIAVSRGISRGCKDFHVTVRSILCCIRGHPEWSKEVLDLCIEFKNRGVVGIDVAGDEAKELCAPTDFEVFKHAAKEGIHRTVHAGEAGPASNVDVAITELLAERIGHGYHIVDDDALYMKAREWGVHFEVCPYSSIMTGSVAVGCPKHPIVKFAEDNINFSISRDDPAIIQKTLDEEYAFLRGFGLKEVHIIRANFNAARNCFLPEEEKMHLIRQLREIYGTEPDSIVPVKPPSGETAALDPDDKDLTEPELEVTWRSDLE